MRVILSSCTCRLLLTIYFSFRMYLQQTNMNQQVALLGFNTISYPEPSCFLLRTAEGLGTRLGFNTAQAAKAWRRFTPQKCQGRAYPGSATLECPANPKHHFLFLWLHVATKSLLPSYLRIYLFWKVAMNQNSFSDLGISVLVFLAYFCTQPRRCGHARGSIWLSSHFSVC